MNVIESFVERCRCTLLIVSARTANLLSLRSQNEWFKCNQEYDSFGVLHVCVDEEEILSGHSGRSLSGGLLLGLVLANTPRS